MNKDKKLEGKRHLRLVEKYDHSQEPFQIGEPDFNYSAHKMKDRIHQFEEGNWTHPGISGKTEEETWIKKKEYKEQTDFTGYGPKGYKRSDDRIYEEVCEALMRSREIDATNIGVKVNEGIVFLSGRVDSRRMKKVAEHLAEEQLGVKDVRNELAVIRGADGPMGPDSITGKDLGIY